MLEVLTNALVVVVAVTVVVLVVGVGAGVLIAIVVLVEVMIGDTLMVVVGVRVVVRGFPGTFPCTCDASP